MTKKRMSSMYVGNDCSAFVCMATFPANGISVNSSVCFQITRDMLSSSTFKKLSGYEQLRPGDLLVKNGHTVMFLYYTLSLIHISPPAPRHGRRSPPCPWLRSC